MANPTTIEEYLALPTLRKRLAEHKEETIRKIKEHVALVNSKEYKDYIVAANEGTLPKQIEHAKKIEANKLGTRKYFLYHRGEIFEKVRSNA